MEALSFVWLLGETASIALLVVGAGLSDFSIEPYCSWYRARPPSNVPRLEAHEPLNHRLLLEPEW